MRGRAPSTPSQSQSKCWYCPEQHFLCYCPVLLDRRSEKYAQASAAKVKDPVQSKPKSSDDTQKLAGGGGGTEEPECITVKIDGCELLVTLDTMAKADFIHQSALPKAA
ncbi:hypothetical protein PR048_025678 [Dryococelus australis]|uniref:Uncharacterized protein n=1 Tax=Dryococelus australis TaxID=614101 RepID=A0ABQ9GJ79_9NEOP|nr:hypothetical protein PR048_025678 [Dryococelus australis]